MTELSGFLYNDAGCAVATSGCSVDIFPTGCNIGKTGGSPTATTDSNACGFWSVSCVTTGQYDVRITSGCSVRFIRYDNEQNVCRLEIKNLVLNDGTSPNYLINVAACICPTTDRTLTLPALSGNRTFQFIDQVQTISAVHTHSADQIFNDGTDLAWGTSSDSLMRWSCADASNHALVLGLQKCNQVFHIAEVCDIATDWNTAGNCLHAELHIHSSTTPATDYLNIGAHDGTIATIDVVGGTTLNLSASGSVMATVICSGCTPQLRIREPTGGGASYVAIQTAALAANWTLSLPACNGTCGEQLTTDGCGVTSWAAASLGTYKDDLGLLNPADALATLVATPIHKFRYNRCKTPADQWGCFTHEMTGIFAEEAPWAMHGRDKKAFSPINSVGMLTAAVQALEARLAALE